MREFFSGLRLHAFVFLAALLCTGCAAGVLPILEPAATAVSLGSLGQTLLNATYFNTDNTKVAVAPLPQNYQGARDTMIREAWEQNYQYIKRTQWEDEDTPWKDLARTALRKSRGESPTLVLVEKKAVRQTAITEERVFYTTASGRLVRNPAEAAGENYLPHARTQKQTVTIYAYTAYYFTRSLQPSGILTTAAPKSGVCGPGALIAAVGKKTPGDTASLRSGDVITHINGYGVDHHTALTLLRPGQNTFRLCRQGAVSDIQVSLPSPRRK